MSQSILTFMGPMDLAAAVFTLPLFSLVLAGFIVVGILVVPRVRRRRGSGAAPGGGAPLPTVPARYRSEHRALGIGAIAVIVAYAVENVIRGYLLDLVDIVEWWQYATPVFAAVFCLTVGLGLIVVRGTPQPDEPVVPTARRTWLSFGPRAGFVGGTIALVTLLATTIAAGLASSSDERGRFIYLEIPVPNTQLEPLRPWFYGWDFGVPVLLGLAALVLVTWATLHRNALRPYLRPEPVAAERNARTQVASGAVAIATAATLLALGGAFRFIGRYGSMSQLTVGNDDHGITYDMTWRYAEFAALGGGLAPALEVTGFALLLLVAIRLLRRPAPERQHPRPQPSTQPESVR
ncbi:hypothetical protein C3B61_17110 [Cryobacterium zongtaii]|uniref:Uncharacterized protein n=1 Tax=Cryobacterium zongtaii TaxID=1259217 RepID=A0A2S3ZAI6_9MICO|nr:hypothetical protein [Cryobacterium zongtaii]POH62564.1 hypothetical protein C3B61_17110 [Cryobacterium zongtaii]